VLLFALLFWGGQAAAPEDRQDIGKLSPAAKRTASPFSAHRRRA
jgi:hypothetical protein